MSNKKRPRGTRKARHRGEDTVPRKLVILILSICALIFIVGLWIYQDLDPTESVFVSGLLAIGVLKLNDSSQFDWTFPAVSIGAMAWLAVIVAPSKSLEEDIFKLLSMLPLIVAIIGLLATRKARIRK